MPFGSRVMPDAIDPAPAQWWLRLRMLDAIADPCFEPLGDRRVGIVTAPVRVFRPPPRCPPPPIRQRADK
jgi:hypothetical protein